MLDSQDALSLNVSRLVATIEDTEVMSCSFSWAFFIFKCMYISYGVKFK